MSERFFALQPITGETAELVGAEAQHLATVMRAKVGDEVTLFDGSGSEFAARISRLGKAAVQLVVLERREVSRELPIDLTLAVALPKGERQKWLVEKLVELGTTRLAPLVAQHGVAEPVDAALARLRRGVIEASKQCGRNRLMEIAAPREVCEFFAAQESGSLLLLAHPGGAGLPATLANAKRVVAAVGPEGGFTDEEVSAAQQHGWRTVSLGRSILRVETAAIALAAWSAIGVQ